MLSDAVFIFFLYFCANMHARAKTAGLVNHYTKIRHLGFGIYDSWSMSGQMNTHYAKQVKIVIHSV